MSKTHLRRYTAAALGGFLALSLAACGSEGAGTATGGDEAEDKSITLGYIPAWSDGLSVANLTKVQLEELGYDVEMEELTEAGALYTALAKGDIDIYPSAWPEVTHASYMETYGDQIESLGDYYDNAILTWAVPSYSEIESIEDIPNYADVLGNKIIGIEPGAGLTEASQDRVIPDYGLENFELVTSSTTAMLAELQSAVNGQNEIVVTLWRPFWANAEFDMRDLEDPNGSLGEPEALHFLATAGFSDQHPEIAEWIGGITLDDEQYGSLEDTVVNQFDSGQEPEAVRAWLEANPDVLPALPQS